MAIFKCKMCGGQLDISEGMTVCECEYCGTQQTLPKLQDDVTANLFNRANNLRMKSEFDKALEIYEKIVANNPAESEAYWGLVLCKYGIEYVEDPATLKKIPTCHRTQLESIMTDIDYQSAVEHADSVQRGVYEREAAAIDKLQKDILAIVHKEKPFDVFICYKETDENGKRTNDSVIANDIYHQLTQEGFKVFYAAITLEDKLGQEYEPYIFAALNSAKVMLCIGTKSEYFNAVWVKNEWSRFLKLMKADRSKLLIPCYKDMDAYDLPDEFSHLQAQDMGKIGFINDLIRGIKKVIVKDEPKPQVVQQTVVQSAANANVESLLKRVRLFLEDGEWNSANDYCNRVLDIDAECAQAYYYLLMAKLKIRTEQNFEKYKSEKGIKNEDYYNKAYRFADDALKARLNDLHQKAIYNTAEAKLQAAGSDQDYVNAWHIYEKISGYQDATDKIAACKDAVYAHAASVMNSADMEKAFREAAAIFALTTGFKDADQKQQECLEKAELAHKGVIYRSAMSRWDSNQVKSLEEGVRLLNEIPDYQDAAEQIEKFKAKIEETKARDNAAAVEQRAAEAKVAEAKKKKIITIVASVMAVVVLCVIGIIIGINVHKSNLYKSAISAFESGDYDKAMEEFTELGNYKDSAAKILEIEEAKIEANYQTAVSAFESGDYDKAIEMFTELGDYKDSADYLAKPIDILTADVGDIVKFGDYTWYVINKTDSGCTLLSEKCITEKEYNEKAENVTWEECTLRSWLNNDFYSEFSDEEKAMIENTRNSTPGNSGYGTDGGNDTDDYVFLLSIDELKDISYDLRKTDLDWWLRSPGESQRNASRVRWNGTIDATGKGVVYEFGVRPVLNLKFN